MTTTTERYSSALADYRQLQEQRREAPDAVTVDQVQAAGERMERLWRAADAEWRSSLGAATLSRESRGIRVRRTDGRGGGSSTLISTQDDRYAAALAQLEADEQTDAAVAQAAYAHWGWTGPVRIDYYGDTARVTDGGRRCYVHIPTLTARD